MQIYCCTCNEKVEARLTNGSKVYPHRKDLAELPFWICDTCGNFVGCHKVGEPFRPLGVIASKDIKKLRIKIHDKLDPLWKNKHYKRKELYAMLSKYLGFSYHTASLRSVEECHRVLEFVNSLRSQIIQETGKFI